MRLDAKNICKSYASRSNGKMVLRDLSFTVGDGRFVTLLGPSGCGKTTLLNLVAGFQQPTSGSIELNGAPISGPGPDRAFIFQDYALFPWMTVRNNVLYPMKQRKIPPAEREERLDRLLALAHLEDCQHLYPNRISGGMKQRTALVRALACDPQVLLMDEPLGALDVQMRQMLQEEIEAIWLESRTTVLMVTHDIEESITLSDRVLVMSACEGKIVEDVRIGLERPRDRLGRRYREFKEYLTELLKVARDPGNGGAEPGGMRTAV